MFGTLMESSSTPQRRRGSSFVSMVFHALVIAAGVMATANEAKIVVPPPLEVHIVHYAPPAAQPPASSRAAAVSRAALAGVPALPRLNVPSIVPVGIPPVDLTATPTSAEYVGGPIGRTIDCAPDACPGHALIDGDRTLWSTRDIMMQLRDNPAPPRYPESLRRAGVEGDVIVKFIVDTTGRVDMGSVEVLSSTHEAFAASVREALGHLRFTPSMVGERKLKALAIMPFRFRLR